MIFRKRLFEWSSNDDLLGSSGNKRKDFVATSESMMRTPILILITPQEKEGKHKAGSISVVIGKLRM